MINNNLMLEIYNPNITKEDIKILFEEILNQRIYQQTKLVLEIVN